MEFLPHILLGCPGQRLTQAEVTLGQEEGRGGGRRAARFPLTRRQCREEEGPAPGVALAAAGIPPQESLCRKGSPGDSGKASLVLDST